MPELNVHLLEVNRGPSDYWLQFKGRIPTYDYNKSYLFDYCGTELRVAGSGIIDEANRMLCEKMVDDFGFGPYNIEKARSILGDIKHYRITW